MRTRELVNLLKQCVCQRWWWQLGASLPPSFEERWSCILMLTTEYDDDAANRWELCDCAVALFSFDYCRYLCATETTERTTKRQQHSMKLLVSRTINYMKLLVMEKCSLRINSNEVSKQMNCSRLFFSPALICPLADEINLSYCNLLCPCCACPLPSPPTDVVDHTDIPRWQITSNWSL